MKYYNVTLDESDKLTFKPIDLAFNSRESRGKTSSISGWYKDGSGELWYLKPIVSSTEKDAINEIIAAPIYEILLNDDDSKYKRTPEVQVIYDSANKMYYTASKQLENYNDLDDFRKVAIKERYAELEPKALSREGDDEIYLKADLLPREEFEYTAFGSNTKKLKRLRQDLRAKKKNLRDLPEQDSDKAEEINNKILKISESIKTLEGEQQQLMDFMKWWEIPGIFEVIFVCGIMGKQDLTLNMGIVGDPDGECIAATVDHGFVNYCSAKEILNIFVGLLNDVENGKRYIITEGFKIGIRDPNHPQSVDHIKAALKERENEERILDALGLVLKNYNDRKEAIDESFKRSQKLLELILKPEKYKKVSALIQNIDNAIKGNVELYKTAASEYKKSENSIEIIDNLYFKYPSFPSDNKRNDITGNFMCFTALDAGAVPINNAVTVVVEDITFVREDGEAVLIEDVIENSTQPLSQLNAEDNTYTQPEILMLEWNSLDIMENSELEDKKVQDKGVRIGIAQ